MPGLAAVEEDPMKRRGALSDKYLVERARRQ